MALSTQQQFGDRFVSVTGQGSLIAGYCVWSVVLAWVAHASDTGTAVATTASALLWAVLIFIAMHASGFAIMAASRSSRHTETAVPRGCVSSCRDRGGLLPLGGACCAGWTGTRAAPFPQPASGSVAGVCTRHDATGALGERRRRGVFRRFAVSSYRV